jgi:hypothetical protein
MKLNNSHIRQIFLANIKQRTPEGRKECLSPKQLLKLFRTKKSETKKTRIIDHITNCYYCANEFEFILRALRYEKTLNNVAENLIRSKRIKVPSTKLSWKTASAISGISAFFFLITIFIISNTHENSNHRTSTISQIAIVLPLAKNISESSLHFRWEEVRDSEYYTFELYDETLYQIWSSDKILRNNFKLPKETASRLEANKPYFWMISAFFPNGRKIESQLREIILTE